jgi:hypothetical protein
LFEEPSGEVVLVPACLDKDDLAVGFEACRDVVVEPVVDTVAVSRTVGLGPRLDGIVDDYEICSVTRDARTDADRPDTAALGGFPLGLGVYAAKVRTGSGSDRIRLTLRSFF